VHECSCVVFVSRQCWPELQWPNWITEGGRLQIVKRLLSTRVPRWPKQICQTYVTSAVIAQYWSQVRHSAVCKSAHWWRACWFIHSWPSWQPALLKAVVKCRVVLEVLCCNSTLLQIQFYSSKFVSLNVSQACQFLPPCHASRQLMCQKVRKCATNISLSVTDVIYLSTILPRILLMGFINILPVLSVVTVSNETIGLVKYSSGSCRIWKFTSVTLVHCCL